jgi:ABC-type transport system involved in multi-copper enzyme maturation permease subunit
MVGPVFHNEMLLNGRRNRLHALRWIWAGWLVVQLLGSAFVAWAMTIDPFSETRQAVTPLVAGWFVEWFVIQLLLFLALATPVLTAGAITDEKSRGTLQYLLTTDLQSWHIIVGKMLARVFQLSIPAIAGLPLFFFLGPFAGVGPLTVVGLFGVILLTAFGLAAASLLASVWCRQTRDAVLGLYAVTLPFLLLVSLAWSLPSSHPGVVVTVVALEACLLVACLLRAGSCLVQRRPLGDWLVAGFYLFLGLFLAIAWAADLLPRFHPAYVLQPVWGGSADFPELLARLLWAAALWGSVGAVCLGLAVWQLRPAYIRQLEGEGRKKEHWWRASRPAVATDPIRWKERHVDGLAPLNALRAVPRWLAVLTIFLASVASTTGMVYLSSDAKPGQVWGLLQHGDVAGLLGALAAPPASVSAEAPYLFQLQGLVAMLIASLVVGIRCSGAISGEREKQTWEALLLTPLSSRQLVRGKVWGIMGASYLYLLVYAVPALALSAVSSFWAFFWTGIWLAVSWLAMYFVGAAGIWCSVRSKSSWRSLLGTVGMGYGGGVVVYLLTSPVIFVLAAIILLFLALVDTALGTELGKTAVSSGVNNYFEAFKIASCLVLAAVFWGLAWFFLSDAQKWIADRERTRHWKDEPLRLPPLRKRSAVPRFYR